MNKMLKRDPAVIVRKAMTHLRKNYMSSRSSAGKETIRQLKLAVARIENARLQEILKRYRLELTK